MWATDSFTQKSVWRHIRSAPMAAQKMRVSVGFFRQRRDFLRHGRDVFCWRRESLEWLRNLRVGLGSAFHATLEKRIGKDGNKVGASVGDLITIPWSPPWDGPPSAERWAGAVLLPRPSRWLSVLVRFRRRHPEPVRRFDQEETKARSSTVVQGPPHPGGVRVPLLPLQSRFSTWFYSQDPMAAAALMTWAQVSEGPSGGGTLCSQAFRTWPSSLPALE